MPEVDLLPRTAARPAAPASRLQLSELLGALSHALDITEGQPKGHCIRVCWIGMHIGRHLGLDDRERWELYYTLLLKDLGCSSNAARICELYLTDDLHFKRGFKTVGEGLPQMLRFVFTHTGLRAGLSQRLGAVMNIMRNGPQIAQELIETRCQRGADIARQLRFAEPVAQGIASLDEHWNGHGKPAQLSGESIPLYSRIALLAQVVDVMHTAGGREAAIKEATARAGSWFDPELVRAFEAIARHSPFWAMLQSGSVEQAVLTLEPGTCSMPVTTTTSTTSPWPLARSWTQRARTPAATARVWRTTPTALPPCSASPRRAGAGCAAARCCTTWASSA